MKIRIEGREYPVVDHRSGAKLLHLVELREHTRTLLEEPLGMGRLDELARQARELVAGIKAAERDYAAARDDGAGPVQLEELAGRVRALKGAQADDGLLGLAIVVFLSRRAAGDRVTFAQATTVDVGQIDYVEEPGDAQVVAPDEGEQGDPFGPEAPDPTVPVGAPAPASPETPGGAHARPVRARKTAASRGGRSTTSGSR